MPKPKNEKQVPLSALRFAADVQFAAEGADPAKVPVTLTARSKEPTTHWYWGRVVHDMAGFTLAKPTLPIDYMHSEYDILGYADKFDVASGDLVASGYLTPFTPDDRASEVIFKRKQGVPYESSIFFDPEAMVVEWVPEGMTVQVNGYAFNGPGNVIRQWTLRGLAVCPHGQDGNSSVEFAHDKGREVSVSFTELQAMPPVNEAAPVTEAPKETVAPVVPTTPAVVEPTVVAPVVPVVDEPKTELNAGKKFLTSFGAQGGVWYAEGKTFEEAQVLFNQSLTAENESLKLKLAEATTKLSAKRGERSPVSFQATEEPAPVKRANLGEGLSKFASTIKLPTK